MLSEDEVRERAQYCCCVLLQLGWLQHNQSVHPYRYLEYLKKSSLDLANDRFIAMTIEEAMMTGLPDGGLTALIHLYEGFVHAFCVVLETDVEGIKRGIPEGFLKLLASEVGAQFDAHSE